jgi:hypothetical protein
MPEFVFVLTKNNPENLHVTELMDARMDSRAVADPSSGNKLPSVRKRIENGSLPEFAGEPFVRTDTSEGRDPNEKLTVVLDYFRYAFVRPKAFSGLVVFDVLPSKESPETTRFWVRMDPSEVKEPVLTGYGDPPASLSKTKPIRVTMGRDDFFYLWSGEASSPALVAALLVTGRVKVDNWLRFGDLRHFVSSFNYATPSWIAFYRGRGQNENVERLFEAQRIRARVVGKIVDENTGDIVDPKPIETEHGDSLSNVAQTVTTMAGNVCNTSDSSSSMSMEENVNMVKTQNASKSSDSALNLNDTIDLSGQEVRSTMTNQQGAIAEQIPLDDLSSMSDLQLQNFRYSQVEDMRLVTDNDSEQHQVLYMSFPPEHEKRESPSSISKTLQSVDTPATFSLSSTSTPTSTSILSSISELLLDQPQGTVSSLSLFAVPLFSTNSINGEDLRVDFTSFLPEFLQCAPISASEIASLASSLHLQLFSGLSDVVEATKRFTSVETVISPYLESARENIERAVRLEALFLKSLPSEITNSAKSILSLDGFTRLIQTNVRHVADNFGRALSLLKEVRGQSTHIQREVESLNQSSAAALHHAAKELRLVAAGKVEGTFLSLLLSSASPSLLTSFIIRNAVFGQFTTSSVAFETPIIQLIRNSETLKSLTERSDEALLGNITSKVNLSRYMNSPQIVSLNEQLLLDFDNFVNRETNTNGINYLVHSSLAKASTTITDSVSIRSNKGIDDEMTKLNLHKSSSAFNVGPTELVKVARESVIGAARAGGAAALKSIQVHFPGLFTSSNESSVDSHVEEVFSLSSTSPDSSLLSVSKTSTTDSDGSKYAHLWHPSLKPSWLPIINPPFHFLPILSMSNDNKHSRPVTVSEEALEFTSLSNKSEIVNISDVSELDAISYCLGASPYFFLTSAYSPPVSLAALQLKDDRVPMVSKVGLIPVMWKHRKNILDEKGAKFAVFNGLGSGLFLSTAKERARMRLEDENSDKVNNSAVMSLSRKFANVGSMRVKFADLDG